MNDTIFGLYDLKSVNNSNYVRADIKVDKKSNRALIEADFSALQIEE